MNEPSRAGGSPLLRAESEALDHAAGNALAQRRARGEILTYELNGWVVEEHPGGNIRRLAPVGQFRADEFPYTGFNLPQH